MPNYDSFVFEGHGKSEATGGFDPGAVNGSVTENQLVKQIVAKAKYYLNKTGLNIHYDENNYSDKDLNGNSYTFKCGLSVHINSTPGATGTEIFVPCKEKYLDSDFNIVNKIATQLNIPNRGVKSRDYDSEATFQRQNGVSLNYNDYYGEIRDAWNRGISLAILEVGFIQNDLQKIQSNIDKIGFFVAEYIAKNCNKTVVEDVAPPTPPTPPTPPNTGLKRVFANGQQVGAYNNLDNAIAEVKKQVENGIKEVTIKTV